MNNLSEQANNRVLVVDDNPAIHEDFEKILRGNPYVTGEMEQAEATIFGEAPAALSRRTFQLDSALQGQDALNLVEKSLAEGRPYAMAFVDIRMPPGWDGIETIEHLWRSDANLQVVICTAYSDYSWEEIVRRLGNTDSLVILKKPFDSVEVLQMAHALTRKWDLGQRARLRLVEMDRMVQQRTEALRKANEELQKEIDERFQVQTALRLSEERFSKAFEASPLAMAIMKLPGLECVDVNESFLSLVKSPKEALLGRNPAEGGFLVETAAWETATSLLDDARSVKAQPVRIRARSGSIRDALLFMEPFRLENELHALVVIDDVTERLALENQLRQAQKMEAVGQLAAGIAHDFNNILTIIEGHISLLLVKEEVGHQVADSLKQVSSATERAASLTRQLLAFSRKQFMNFQAHDMNGVILNLKDMLGRLIGENISLSCALGQGPFNIRADVTCLEQVLVNLAVNARDAMPAGGKLIISTGSIALSEKEAAENPDRRTGEFVRVAVADTGCGIPPEVLGRLFEPFFTTKDVGKGTGLGLATAYGILKQHDGWIEVASQMNRGTTFALYLPTQGKPAKPEVPLQRPPVVRGKQEKVLVVEDESPLRIMICEALKAHGYQVFPACNGVEALRLWEERNGRYDLLLTDIVMPEGISGRQLAETLLMKNARLKVLFSSGYGMDDTDLDELANSDVHYLPKPYNVNELARTVRDCLDHRTDNHKAYALGRFSAVGVA